MNNVFIAIYTNEVKRYCDEIFFDNIRRIVPSTSTLVIVDNSPTTEYTERIRMLMDGYGEYTLIHIDLPKEESHRFQKSVLKSLKVLEKEFLNSYCEYFLIIESDVIPSEEDFDLLVEDAERNPDFGAIGGLYYSGIHNRIADAEVVEEECVFSGFTIYSRKAIQEIGFSWNESFPPCFPDSCMKYELLSHGYKVGNDHRIFCPHLK